MLIAGLLTLYSCTKTVKVVEVEKVVRLEKECHDTRFIDSLKDSESFESALRKNEKLLADSPTSPPGDEALCNMGLIYAHARNPRKNYKKSLECFRRMVRQFPDSRLVGEAKVWIWVLEDMEKALKVDIDIQKKRKELEQ